MAMTVNGGGGYKADINVTPLVDVVLVLLIIFMVITPLLVKALEVDVPEKTEVEVEDESVKTQVVVEIKANGDIFINKQPIELGDIPEKIERLMRGRKTKVVFFDIDDGANFGYAVKVMDNVKKGKAKILGMMTGGKKAWKSGRASSSGEI